MVNVFISARYTIFSNGYHTLLTLRVMNVDLVVHTNTNIAKFASCNRCDNTSGMCSFTNRTLPALIILGEFWTDRFKLEHGQEPEITPKSTHPLGEEYRDNGSYILHKPSMCVF